MRTETVIGQIRAFNRFYVDALGLLRSGGYHSDYSLTETRILFEISQAGCLQASQIITGIHIDKSYLSRILKKLEKDGLIIRKPSGQDARAFEIWLTKNGESEIDNIDKAASEHVNSQISKLENSKRDELVTHMQAIMEILKTKQM